MTLALPDDVADAIVRIDTPPDVEVHVRPGLTGELATLSSWWQRLAGDAPVVAAYVVVDPYDAMPDTAPGGNDCARALSVGLAAANRAIDSGATLLVPGSGPGPMWDGRVRPADPASPVDPAGPDDDVRARALIGLLTKRDASSVLGQPLGMPDGVWMDECARIRDTMAEHRALLGEQLSLLDAVDGHAIAVTAGALIGAAARRTPCLIDGTSEWAAALVADRIAHRARHWWRAASTSTDPAWTAARDRTDIPAGLPLGLDHDGWGARVTIALLEMIQDGRA